MVQFNPTNSEMNKPRSLKNNNRVYVIFFNRTQRNVHIIWMNFDGEPVIYKTLEPGATMQMFTFECHAWLFEDSCTGDKLLGDGQEVFYAKQDNRNSDTPKIVLLSCPLISLRQRAVQVIRDSIEDFEIEELSQIPHTLLNDIQNELLLKELAVENYIEYQKFTGY